MVAKVAENESREETETDQGPTQDDFEQGRASVSGALSLLRAARKILRGAESNPAIEQECSSAVESACEGIGETDFQLRVASGLLHVE